MKTIKISALLLLGVLVLIQWIQPSVQRPIRGKAMSGVPEPVMHILRNSCYDCHSNESKLSWFDHITPANFLVASHIKNGKKALNFSNWDSLAAPQQKAVLYYALNKILGGEMPLPAYTALHPRAKLNDTDMLALKTYVTSLSPRAVAHQQLNKKGSSQSNTIAHGTVSKAPNGISYTADYRNWKAISTTDRFDNGTLRIIFGNDVAVQAIEEKNTNPWPNGTIFAKVAWKQEADVHGNINPGEFVQVEFMIKDDKKYANTEGWGWARWKGDHLKPYGNNLHFDQECISCHQPVKDNDFVFTKSLNLNRNNVSRIK